MPEEEADMPGVEPASAAPDRARLRGLAVHVNDGIIATAGIVEGFIGAGAGASAILVAVVAAMIAGGVALGAAEYGEAAVERDAQRMLVEEERRQLNLSPEEELAELAELYRAKGLSAELAGRVAAELSAQDALAAHADAEHGIALHKATVQPLVTAISSGAAFAVGAAVLLPTALLSPTGWRVPSTFLAVALALCLTSIALARWGRVPVARTVFRTVGIGVGAMLVTLVIGSLFDL